MNPKLLAALHLLLLANAVAVAVAIAVACFQNAVDCSCLRLAAAVISTVVAFYPSSWIASDEQADLAIVNQHAVEPAFVRR